MSRTVFVPDKDLERKLMESQQVADGLLPLAEQAVTIAVSNAPERTGHYKDGIKAISGVNDDGVAVARIVGYDFKSHWIEFGTGPPQPTPPLNILRNAVEAVVGTVR